MSNIPGSDLHRTRRGNEWIVLNERMKRMMCWVIYRAANDPSVFTITEKAPTRDFSWLKGDKQILALSPLRHYKETMINETCVRHEKLSRHGLTLGPIVGAFSVIVKTDG